MYYAKIKDQNGVVNLVQTNLKTAKALTQIVVDEYRSVDEHLRQRPVHWVRRHSDRVVYWEAFVDGRFYDVLIKI